MVGLPAHLANSWTRPWLIIVAGALAATMSASLLFLPGGIPYRGEPVAALLRAQWPAIAVAWLALYSVAALVFTTVGAFLENDAVDHAERRWAQRYLLRLAAAQYFTAVLALLAFGLSRIPVEPVFLQALPVAIAASPAFAACGAAVIVGLLGWLSLAVATAFRRTSVSQPSVEGAELRLLREIIALLHAPAAPAAEAAPLAELIAQAQRPVLEAVKELAAAVDRLGRRLHEDLAEIKNAPPNQASQAPPETGVASFAAFEEVAMELRAAVAALDVVAVRLRETALSLSAKETPSSVPAKAPAPSGARSRLSSELQALLRELPAGGH